MKTPTIAKTGTLEELLPPPLATQPLNKHKESRWKLPPPQRYQGNLKPNVNQKKEGFKGSPSRNPRTQSSNQTTKGIQRIPSPPSSLIGTLEALLVTNRKSFVHQYFQPKLDNYLHLMQFFSFLHLLFPVLIHCGCLTIFFLPSHSSCDYYQDEFECLIPCC